MSMTLRYLSLEVGRSWRNRRYLVFSVGMPLVFFFIWSNIFGGDGSGRNSTKAYLMTSMAAYGCLTASVSAGVRIAVERATGWNRQLKLTALPPASYFTGKLGVSMALAVPSIVLVFLAGALVEGISMPAGAWALTAVCTWLGLLPFAALGIVIGYVAGPDAVQALLPLVTIGLSLLGGLWVPVTQMPSVMADIAHAVPSYWLGELSRRALTSSTVDGASVTVLLAWTVVLGLLAVRLFRRETARGW